MAAKRQKSKPGPSTSPSKRNRSADVPAGPPRWPSALMLVAGVVALGGMLHARSVEGKDILNGLLVVGVGIGLMVAALAARAAGRHLFRPGVLGPVTAVVAAVGVAIRVYLLSTVPQKAEGPLPVVMHREILIGVPVTLAAFALILSTWAVYRTVSLPAGGLSEAGRKNDLFAGVLALAAALYTLGPLLSSLGIPLNHWTFLGLVGLGVIAFGLATAVEKIFG